MSGRRPCFVDAARAWLALDTDPTTRDEVQSMLDAGEHDALADRLLGARLEFGTAGLRGEMGGARVTPIPPLIGSFTLCAYRPITFVQMVRRPIRFV